MARVKIHMLVLKSNTQPLFPSVPHAHICCLTSLCSFSSFRATGRKKKNAAARSDPAPHRTRMLMHPQPNKDA